MTEDDLARLRMPQRLALTYAPRSTRAGFAALFLLDATLADIVRQAREPMLAQLRLAWWRDRFDQDVADRPAGNPLLTALADWAGEEAALRGLVDGWEQLLTDGPLTPNAMADFATGRAECFAALARLHGGAQDTVAAQAGRPWALVDLVSGLSDPHEREAALALARLEEAPVRALPRAMRPLTVLAGLAHRALKRTDGAMLAGTGDMLAAMRLGLLGR